jgi:hypothetical protein
VATDASVDEAAVRDYLRAINEPGEDLEDVDWSIFHPGDCCG